MRTKGYGEADLDALIRSAIASRPLIITRDTLIRAGDTIRANVLVLKSRFILDGTVRGQLTAVEANVYLRPNARVSGDVVNIAGGYYPSELARTGYVEDRPLAPYHVTVDNGEYTIEGMVTRPALKLLGGVQLPEYNRVDGLRAEIGPRVLLWPLGSVEPSIAASIGFATERKEMMGRAELRLKRGHSSLTFGWADNITVTNEDWIRGRLNNSLSFIWNGKDYRNYHQVDRVHLEFRRVLEKGERTSAYWIRGQNEISSALAEGDPFVLFKPDSVRVNPFVPSLRVTSMIVGVQSEWKGQRTVWSAAGALEFAAKLLDADRAFNAYTLAADYATLALANHTLRIQANFRGPLPGTEDLPQQRWTFVGGSGTLYTFRINEFRGDRLAFIETEYRIPFAPRFRLPMLGQPTLRLMHNAGMAWSRTQDRDFEQNVGVRIQLPVAYVRALTNPRDFSGDMEFSAGVTLPGKAYPWEKRR